MRFRNSVKASEMSLSLIPNVLNTVNVLLLVREPLSMINPEMFKASNIQDMIRTIVVRRHNAIGAHALINNRLQRLPFRVRNHFRLHTPSTLEQPKDRDFSRSPSPASSFPHPTNIAFIHTSTSPAKGVSSRVARSILVRSR